MLHMFCNGYTRVFLVFLDVCCKCFNCFGRMLQMFHLDVVYLVLHTICRIRLLQLVGLPACAWGLEGVCERQAPACMRMGVEGVRERQA